MDGDESLLLMMKETDKSPLETIKLYLKGSISMGERNKNWNTVKKLRKVHHAYPYQESYSKSMEKDQFTRYVRNINLRGD